MVDSKIILGTVQFGLNYGVNNKLGKPSVNKVFEMLEYASSKGITILDTADVYGNASEILGNYISKNPDTFLINTKFKSCNLSVERQLEISLLKLNSDFINVYFFHSFNDFIKYPKLHEQFQELKRKCKIKKIGLSVYGNDEFRKACESEIIDVIQLPFNLLDNNSQRGRLLKFAKNNSKEIQVRSIFLQGLLFKPLAKISSKLIPLLPYLEEIQRIAKNAQVSVNQLALNYALHQNEIDNVVIGVDSLEQLCENIKMSKDTIPDEAIDDINQIVVKEVELLYPKNW